MLNDVQRCWTKFVCHQRFVQQSCIPTTIASVWAYEKTHFSLFHCSINQIDSSFHFYPVVIFTELLRGGKTKKLNENVRDLVPSKQS